MEPWQLQEAERRIRQEHSNLKLPVGTHFGNWSVLIQRHGRLAFILSATPIVVLWLGSIVSAFAGIGEADTGLTLASLLIAPALIIWIGSILATVTAAVYGMLRSDYRVASGLAPGAASAFVAMLAISVAVAFVG